MSSQQHADLLLAMWQQRRDLPPAQRLQAIGASRPISKSFRASVEVGS